MNSGTLFTIGHSDRDLNVFVKLLKNSDIDCLVDIRSYPHSTRFPHFSQDALRQLLINENIHYQWAGHQLGGIRKPSNANTHVALDKKNMKGFAEYMQQGIFVKACQQLINTAVDATTAILCAEKLPENCHRSLISDYLTLRKIEILHIIEEGLVKPHTVSQFARAEASNLVYDRLVTGSLDLL